MIEQGVVYPVKYVNDLFYTDASKELEIYKTYSRMITKQQTMLMSQHYDDPQDEMKAAISVFINNTTTLSLKNPSEAYLPR